MSNSNYLTPLFIICSSIFCVAASNNDDLHPILKRLAAQGIDNFKATPINGIYQFSMDSEIFYISEDGNYLINGEIFDLDNNANLTELSRRKMRTQMLKDIKLDDMIIFSPTKKADFVVNVFTDIDCSYCNLMQQQIEEYTDLGIEIRYLAFPREGLHSPAYQKMVNIWCAENKKEAFNLAKEDKNKFSKRCQNIIDKQYLLALKMGIYSAPTVFLENGSMISGYVSAASLLDILHQQNDVINVFKAQ